MSFTLHTETSPLISANIKPTLTPCWIRLNRDIFYRDGKLPSRPNGLTVLDTSAVLSITGPSATQTGQGGGSLTMLIKHQGGGAQPRAQPTRDWEDSNTCTYGLPEYTTSREHVLHHTGEREEERKGKKSRVFTVLVYNIIL